MKKGIVLTVVMLASLPSCRGPKKKHEPNKLAVIKEVDIFSSVDIPLADETEDEMNVALDDADTVQSFFDSETGEFESEEDLSVAMVNGGEVEQKDAQEDFSWIEAVQEGDEEFKVVYFGWDSDEVSVEQKESVAYDIQQIQEELNVSKKTEIEPTIVVEGHACHSAGSLAYNLALSEKRAKKVADRFVGAGIDRNNIKVVGRGQDVPALVDSEKVTGSREEQWLNRRVEVRIIYS